MNEVLRNLTGRFSGLVEGLKGNKKVGAALIFCAAAVLLFAFCFGEGSAVQNEVHENAAEEKMQEYENLEKEISAFIENINGAGKTQIMITYESTAEKIYAYDTSENINDEQAKKQERNYKSEHIIVKNGGEENGLTVKEVYPKIRGIAVICQGGNNPVVKEKITSVLSALFNINTRKISVAAMAD